MFKNWLNSNATLLTAAFLSASIHVALTEIYSTLDLTTPLATNHSIGQPIKVSITTNPFKKEITSPIKKVIKEKKTKKTDKLLVAKKPAKEQLALNVTPNVSVNIEPEPIKKEVTITSPIKVASVNKAVQTTQGILINKTPDNNEKEQLYLAQLLRHIEQHKFYPNKAKRRNIEGTVMVTFTMDHLGNTNDVRLDEGHHFLRKAAELAIANANPLPQPPNFLTTPKTIQFGMTYQLER